MSEELELRARALELRCARLEASVENLRQALDVVLTMEGMHGPTEARRFVAQARDYLVRVGKEAQHGDPAQPSLPW